MKKATEPEVEKAILPFMTVENGDRVLKYNDARRAMKSIMAEFSGVFCSLTEHKSGNLLFEVVSSSRARRRYFRLLVEKDTDCQTESSGLSGLEGAIEAVTEKRSCPLEIHILPGGAGWTNISFFVPSEMTEPLIFTASYIGRSMSDFARAFYYLYPNQLETGRGGDLIEPVFYTYDSKTDRRTGENEFR